jgi:hypothetical protein
MRPTLITAAKAIWCKIAHRDAFGFQSAGKTEWLCVDCCRKWTTDDAVEAVRKDEIRRTIRCALIYGAIAGIAFSIWAVHQVVWG